MDKEWGIVGEMLIFAHCLKNENGLGCVNGVNEGKKKINSAYKIGT